MKRRPFNTLWVTLVRVFFQCTFIPLFRMKVIGSNYPKKGPVVFLCNHQSLLDPIFCQVTINRVVYYVARDSLYKNRFFGGLIRSLNAIPIRRGQADLKAMKSLISILREGHAVCLFPEGTRTCDGKIEEIKPGFSLLVRKTGACVIPMVLDGAYESWPRDKKFPSLKKVAVIYGKPMSAEEIRQAGDKEFSKNITVQMRQLQAQCRQLIGREPFDYSEVRQQDQDSRQRADQ